MVWTCLEEMPSFLDWSLNRLMQSSSAPQVTVTIVWSPRRFVWFSGCWPQLWTFSDEAQGPLIRLDDVRPDVTFLRGLRPLVLLRHGPCPATRFASKNRLTEMSTCGILVIQHGLPVGYASPRAARPDVMQTCVHGQDGPDWGRWWGWFAGTPDLDSCAGRPDMVGPKNGPALARVHLLPLHRNPWGTGRYTS